MAWFELKGDADIVAIKKAFSFPDDIDVFVSAITSKQVIFDRLTAAIELAKRGESIHGSRLWSDCDIEEPNTRAYMVIDGDMIIAITTIDHLLQYINSSLTLFEVNIENGLD